MDPMEGVARATTQSLDRRVERLEVANAELSRTVDRLELGQDHLKEMMSARFSTVEATQQATNAKLDQLSTYLQGLVAAAQAQQIAWRETPAAKEILQDLDEHRIWRDAMELRVAKSERFLYAVTVVCALVVIVANLVGPSIVKVFVGS